MGPGYGMMNELTVQQTTQGLVEYILQQQISSPAIVIGFDHRASPLFNLSSRRFAEIAAAVCISRGIRVYMFPDIVATPLVPFSIDHFKCAAGIMITASHNPKNDNGLKVYWSNAAQIVPPHDEEISKAIDANLAPWEIPTHSSSSFSSSSSVITPTSLEQKYIDTVASKLCRHKECNENSKLKVVYTAMHGVGYHFVQSALSAFGFPKENVISVKAQQDPDPLFPTVDFPNPEEGKGALALALSAASENGASLILANDPDADRLAVCEIDNSLHLRLFTGNEIGTLFAYWEWKKWREVNPTADPSNVVMLASTVSSKFLRKMASIEGFTFEETLTGFKWMGSRSAELRAEGKEVLFAYEEAIGFCISDVVKDKDGVAAAAVMMELSNQVYSNHFEGCSSLSMLLEKIGDRYGHFVNCNGYQWKEATSIASIFKHLRNGGEYIKTIGDYEIKDIRDLTTGYDSSTVSGKAELPASKDECITFTLVQGEAIEEEILCTVRASGTEPKLKYYIEGSSMNREKAENLVKDVERVVLEEIYK
eukprot:g483.t1